VEAREEQGARMLLEKRFEVPIEGGPVVLVRACPPGVQSDNWMKKKDAGLFEDVRGRKQAGAATEKGWCLGSVDDQTGPAALDPYLGMKSSVVSADRPTGPS
jgi:hypothetical protein